MTTLEGETDPQQEQSQQQLQTAENGGDDKEPEQQVENGQANTDDDDDDDDMSIPSYAKDARMTNLPRKGLDRDRFSMRIPALHDVNHTAKENHGADHWKVRFLNFVHSPPVQNFLMVLLLLDVCILFVELFLQATYPLCHVIERDAISCCAPRLSGYPDGYWAAAATASASDNHTETEAEHHLRFLSGNDDEHHNLCHDPAVESHEYDATCDPHKWHVVHTVERALFYGTITILSIFLVELIVMMIALQKAFFQQFFYVLDFFIVATSLGLEITFAILGDDLLVTLVGVLIFGRIWRFVRIGHGLIEVTAEYQAQDKECLLDYADSLEQLLLDNGLKLPKKSPRVKYIKKTLTHHGSDVAEGGGTHH